MVLLCPFWSLKVSYMGRDEGEWNIRIHFCVNYTFNDLDSRVLLEGRERMKSREHVLVVHSHNTQCSTCDKDGNNEKRISQRMLHRDTVKIAKMAKWRDGEQPVASLSYLWIIHWWRSSEARPPGGSFSHSEAVMGSSPLPDRAPTWIKSLILPR